jgi:hypothetical protein
MVVAPAAPLICDSRLQSPVLGQIRAARQSRYAKQFSSLRFAPITTGFPVTPAGPNVTQSNSKTTDFPEPYCVKQNTKHSWRTGVIAAQKGRADGDRDMGL